MLTLGEPSHPFNTRLSMRANAPLLKPQIPILLIIGGSGRLGGVLRRAWSLPGTLAPRAVWQARRVGDFAAQGGPSVVFDPLAAPQALAAAVRSADAVLVLAGVVSGDAEALRLNTTLAQAVVRVAAGKPVFLTSSAAVYGAPRGTTSLRETDDLSPASSYGAAKFEMERALRGTPGVSILRIGNVAGADALLGRQAPPEGRALDILPSGHGPARSYIGPQALARAIGRLARLAVAGAALPDVLNLALPGTVTMDALLRAAGESWQARPAPECVIPRVELDVRRALALGLVPEMPATAAAIVEDLRAIGAPA